MNRALLMHDYCVFPGSEEEAEYSRLDRFLDFSKSQFEKDWEEASSVSSSEYELFPELRMESINYGVDETNMDLRDLEYSPLSVTSSVAGDEHVPATPAPSMDNLEDMYNMADEYVAKAAKEYEQSNLNGSFQMAEHMFDFEELINPGSGLMFGIDPSVINPEFLPETSYVTAPVHVQEVNTPVLAAVAFSAPPAPANRRRKSGHIVRDGSGSATPEFVDVKPSLPALVATTRGNKKRLLPAASAPSVAMACTEPTMIDAADASPQPPKKMKKYQLNDPNNHSVRNAKAAKANRDKKKQEETEMKNRIATLEREKQEDRATIAARDRRITELEQIVFVEQTKAHSATGLATIKADFERYFAAIIPPLVGSRGPITVQMAPGLASGQPSAVVTNNMQFPEQHSQILTTHMDFGNNVITYDYNPLLNFN